MTHIAPRRAGLVVFGARVVSIFTGLLFIVMVTHALTTSGFGLLEVVADLLVFSAYPLTLTNFWSARETARGEIVGKTAALGALILNVAGLAIFAVLAFARQSALTTTLGLFLVAVSLVPTYYFYLTSNSLLSVYNPQAVGYVLLVGEISKLAIAAPLLLIYEAGLPGAFAALAGSNIVLGVVGLYFVRGTLGGAVSIAKLKAWLRDSWLPALNQGPNLIDVADTFVAFLIAGPILVGYYQAAFAIALVIGYSNYLSFALYPLLLRGASDKMVGLLFDFMMLFGIPMAVGAAVLSPQLLFLLSRRYTVAALPLAVLAFSVLAGAADTLLDRVLTGKESADLAVEGRFQKLLRSNIFFDAVANLGYSGSYVASVAVIVDWGVRTSTPLLTIATYWAVSQLILTVIFLLVKVWRLGLGIFSGTLRPIAYYTLCAAGMGAGVYFLAPLLVNTDMATPYYGLRLLVLIAAGGAIYFGLLTALDKRSRERFASLRGVLTP
ncbi:MAG: hypothetical protein JRN18_01795 [Nitrososphaerota archaeon]|nr:hypothetical protein [Nitrososphaerota archaeon]MDG6948027.1 hypothetical protein [Nitrososphaerota archaeon]